MYLDLKKIAGFLFILTGVLLLALHAGFQLNLPAPWANWPVLIVFFGLTISIFSRFRHPAGIVLMLIGFFFLFLVPSPLVFAELIISILLICAGTLFVGSKQNP